MKIYIFLPVLVVMLLAGGCSTDFNLEKSVFIEDINNPGLPEYSEWGYNTFGAYIDRKTFVSDLTDLPSKIIVNKDTFNFLLKGRSNSDDISLKFSVIGYSPADYTDLISLNDSTFNLTGKNCIITLTEPLSTKILTVYEGTLVFKRVQKLYVDKVLTESILSGTFNFKTFINAEPVSISNGRFDVGIGSENFYKF